MVTVYLDSQDYSVLSGSKLTPQMESLRDQLLAWSSSGEVHFVFSSVVVCEAAPTGPQAVHYAVERGDLLSALCGKNALIELAELLDAEVKALCSQDPRPVSARSPTSDWFPKIEFDDPPPLEELVLEVLREQSAEMSWTRAQEREAKRKLLKEGKLRPAFMATIGTEASKTYVREIMAKYPMKPENAEVFGRFVLGKANKFQATAALAESVRDPSWLMRWFASTPELAEPIAESVRKPGRELGNQARELVVLFSEFQNKRRDLGLSDDSEHFSLVAQKVEWEEGVDAMALNVAKQICEKTAGSWSNQINAKDIATFCPGINAVVRSLMNSLWENIGGSRKEQPSDSQFPDCMHALYAPYVDVFRADRFMAPHIRAQVSAQRTIVVSRLSELNEAIEERLNSNT